MIMLLIIWMKVDDDGNDDDDDGDNDSSWWWWWKLMMMNGDGGNDGERLWWWLLSSDESYISQRSDVLWRFACGDVFLIAQKVHQSFFNAQKVFLLCPKIKLVVFATFKKAWNTKKNVNAFRDTIFCSKNAELKHPDKIEIIRKESNMPGEN